MSTNDFRQVDICYPVAAHYKDIVIRFANGLPYAACCSERDLFLRETASEPPCTAVPNMLFYHICHIVEGIHRFIYSVPPKQLHCVVNNRLVQHRHHWFGHSAGNGSEPFTLAAGHYYSFHKNNTTFRVEMWYYSCRIIGLILIIVYSVVVVVSLYRCIESGIGCPFISQIRSPIKENLLGQSRSMGGENISCRSHRR